MVSVLKRKGLIQVRVYLNKTEFKEMAADAESTKHRRVGLLLETAKPHGMAGETYSNTDGLSRFLKHTWGYWKEHQAERLEKAAELARRERELEQDKAKLRI